MLPYYEKKNRGERERWTFHVGNSIFNSPFTTITVHFHFDFNCLQHTHTQKKKKKQKQQKRQINQIWHGQASKQRDQYHTPWNRECDKMDIYVYLHCFSFLPWGGNSEIVWEKVQSTHFSSLFTKAKQRVLLCVWERERERERDFIKVFAGMKRSSVSLSYI